MGNKTVSIPHHLEDVWYKIPNRSAWIARMLLEMSDVVVEKEHKAWIPSLNMCNQKHMRGTCSLCKSELKMNDDEIIEEYFKRQNVIQERERVLGDPIYWRDEE